MFIDVEILSYWYWWCSIFCLSVFSLWRRSTMKSECVCCSLWPARADFLSGDSLTLWVRVNVWQCHAKSLVIYVTLNHKTSHKDQFFRNWDLYMIWKLNKLSFHWCMVCYDRTIFGWDTTIWKSGIWGCKKNKILRKSPLKLSKWSS